MFKKKYYISFTGILEHGTVKLYCFQKPTIDDPKTAHHCIQNATKFRFKWWANFNCWLLNKTDDQFRTYKVTPL